MLEIVRVENVGRCQLVCSESFDLSCAFAVPTALAPPPIHVSPSNLAALLESRDEVAHLERVLRHATEIMAKHAKVAKQGELQHQSPMSHSKWHLCAEI